MLGWDSDITFVAFAIDGIPVKQTIVMPPKEDYSQTEQGRDRNEQSMLKAWDQACRQRMREHVVLLKAKLIAITLGFRTVKQEFMADICLPSGNTIGQESSTSSSEPCGAVRKPVPAVYLLQGRAVRLARVAHNHEVAGSNPAPANWARQYRKEENRVRPVH